MIRTHTRRFSFRTRLTLSIALAFAAAGIVLLASQYVAITWLLNQSITAVQSEVEVNLSESDDGLVVIDGEPSSNGVTTAQQTELAQQADEIADEVVRGLMLVSAGILLAFIATSAIVASWLSRSATRRIAEVASATQDISERDLHLRLDLPGPRDEVTDLGDTIDSMLGRLESAFASQDRFIANASHELRTPLATTRTALQVPLRQGRVSSDLLPDIERALSANQRSEQLIQALLTLARGRFTRDIPAETVCLEEVVSKELDNACGIAPQAEIQIERNICAVSVPGHRQLLEQAVKNLIENAILHNVNRGQVAVQLHQVGSEARLQIVNTGVAIDPEKVTQLLEPFQRGSHTRTRNATTHHQGLGLGLAIVAAIAEAHDGSLTVTALRSGGLEATLSIPVGVDSKPKRSGPCPAARRRP